MTGKRTVLKLGEIIKWAKEGRLSKVKSAAENEREMFMFGNQAMKEAALNGHIEVMEYLFDRFPVSIIGTTGVEYRQVMAGAPDEVKEWYRDAVASYIRRDTYWLELIESDGFTTDMLLAMPAPDEDEQHPLILAACADAFGTAVDMLIEDGRANELTAAHFQIADVDSTLLGYLVAFDQFQHAFRPEIWAGRPGELRKLWEQVPPIMKPEIDLTDIFEDARHIEMLRMVRAKKWPRLRGTEKNRTTTKRRSRRK